MWLLLRDDVRKYSVCLIFFSGKLTSPKWKQFRGMHLKVVDKIRLNNVIWREWVMQCKLTITILLAIQQTIN